MAREAERLIKEGGHEPKLLDLRDLGLPSFDNSDCYNHPAFAGLHAAIRDSDGVLLCVPIYNWSIGSAAKGLMEATGATGEGGRLSAWFDKVVTFACAGGLPHSYMAYGPTAMSLMLDFKCIINPYAVYASTRDWLQNGAMSQSLRDRLDKTLAVKIELTRLLRARTYRSGWEV
ncbi:NADPH-dependent FMN reductase [Rhizobium viscosum]